MTARRATGLVAMTLLAVLAFAAVAQAAPFSATPTRTFTIGSFTFGGYAPGFDGTFWRVSGSGSSGTVSHVDDEGNDLGDTFVISYLPLGIAYYGGRVLIPVASTSSAGMVSYDVSTGANVIVADAETSQRMGSNQKIIRSYPSGLVTMGFGQNNKVATLDAGGGSAEHPWYPQAYHGIGINTGYNPAGNAFESCVLSGAGVVVGSPPDCGEELGHFGPNHPGFNYAREVAAGPGGLYVAELNSDRISHVNTVSAPGGVIDFRFGGSGSGAGQLIRPQSVIVQPGTNNVFVSEEGNRRISVFNSAGGFIAAFGYGVRDGANTMQVCGLEIGPCQAGVAYQTNPRSYFSRLDFGPEGELFAHMPLTGEVQVFGVSGGTGGPGPAGGSSPGPAPVGPTPAVPQKIRLAASPLRVLKGKKTKLTATINRGSSCADRRALFQVRAGRSWDNLGKPVRPSKGCKASKRVKVTSKSSFRAVLVGGSNSSTLAQSPTVTVKLK
jgi:hypothetical protein